MNAVEYVMRRHLGRPIIRTCWKCAALNMIRADLVQFDCETCGATNYAREGRWPDDPFPEVDGLESEP